MQAPKALLALVIAMGVMIVLGMAGLVAVVTHRILHPQVALQATLAPALQPAALRSEPAGSRITSMVRQSDRLLAIALTGGGPDRVLVWDLLAGRPLTEIRLAPSP